MASIAKSINFVNCSEFIAKTMQIRLFIPLFLLFFLFSSSQALAANPRKVKATIKTSAECVYCKENLEESLKKVKGIRKVTCDYVKHEVYVVYNSKKITIEQIRTKMNEIGYDADDQKANFDKFKKSEHEK